MRATSSADASPAVTFVAPRSAPTIVLLTVIGEDVGVVGSSGVGVGVGVGSTVSSFSA